MCRSGLALARPEGRLSVSRSGNAALRPSALRRLVNKPASTTRALPTVCAVSSPQFPLPGGVASRTGPAPRPWFAEPTPVTHHTPAVSCEASASDSAASSGLPSAAKTAYLGSLFVLWYAFSVGFGVFNKQVLNVFPYPTTLTLLNLAVGSCLACFMWVTGIQKRPSVTKDMLLRIAPLAVVHTIGNLLTNISLGKVAVSFTHTIKSCEPFFSVILSAIFLGDIPSVALVLSLVPLVGGIALASFTEPSFNWVGLFAALGSNITFTSRNVFSKKVMGSVKNSLDNINLFSIITIMSMCMCAPITMAMDGWQLTPAAISNGAFSNVASKALMAGFCFHAYQQLSYMVLQNVTPVTHSVGKCIKSVVVIVASIIVFQNPIGPLNMLGTAIALLGVCLYSYVKISQKKAKAAADAAAKTG